MLKKDATKNKCRGCVHSSDPSFFFAKRGRFLSHLAKRITNESHCSFLTQLLSHPPPIPVHDVQTRSRTDLTLSSQQLIKGFKWGLRIPKSQLMLRRTSTAQNLPCRNINLPEHLGGDGPDQMPSMHWRSAWPSSCR